MQEEELHEEYGYGYEDEDGRHPGATSGEEYITHINELISEPVGENVAAVAAQYVLRSLYQLSSYLFTKKIQNDEEAQPNQELQMSFNSYLQLMGEDLGKFSRIKTTQRSVFNREAVNMESQLLRCYQRVESIYFEENYVLDLSYFQYFYRELKGKVPAGKTRVDGQMEKLCQSLDLVQINLFSQIHCKFQEYFRVVANFQYLKESVSLHLKKLQTSRKAMAKVKRQFLQKSVRLRKKIIQRQNIQKTLKLIKQVKSIKKLPQVLQSILSSELPYESLSLIQDTKNIVDNLQPLNCLKDVAESIRSAQVRVQSDLTRLYTTQLYIYLDECHSISSVNLEQLWKKIEVNNTCLDQDNSFVLDKLNSSSGSALSDNPQLNQEIQLLDQNNQSINMNSELFPRNEGTQYKIAMILLQSYRYVDFSPDVTKIKISNALMMFVKRFERELLIYLDKVVETEIMQIKGEEREEKVEEEKKEEQGQENVRAEVVEGVSVQFYIKHLNVLNQIFKETINRFLGYLLTLLTEYEEELACTLQEPQNSQKRGQLGATHKRFKQLFQEECSLLPSIFKIIENKIKYLLTLKNISNIDALSFYRWITTLKYWKKYFDYLVGQHPIMVRVAEGDSKEYVEQLKEIVVDNVNRSIETMNLETLLFGLTKDYLDVFHKNTSNNEVVNTLQEDTWQSTQIPPQFTQILFSIFNPDRTALNASVHISDSSPSFREFLNSSGSSDKSLSKGDISWQQDAARTKIKLLKNNIQICGVRFKVNLSFLVLCEWLSQYMKVARILSHVFDKADSPKSYKKVLSMCYQKVYDLMDIYTLKGKELILDTKALQFGKIKSKAINAKHICLLSNCLSVVERIAVEMLEIKKLEEFQMGERREVSLKLLQTTRDQLVQKLSKILNSKTEHEIKNFKEADKNNGSIQLINKTTKSLITAFLQMVEITDEYLDVEGVRRVLKAAFQNLSQNYVTTLLLKGGKEREAVGLLIEKLRFLRKYFTEEYETLVNEIPT